MKKATGALFVLFAAASVLAACNSSGYSPGPSPTSTPGGSCGGPAKQMEMLYPIPGARNVSPSLPAVYVATNGALPPSNSFNLFLSQTNGSSTYTGPFTPVSPSQIPTPRATPNYPNAHFYGTAIAGPYGSSYIIGPDQSVVLLWNDGGTNCVPRNEVGSFKTKG
jgi:hypothetical protein